MHLFNASSLFDENAIKEILNIVNNPEKLRNRLIEAKKMLEFQQEKPCLMKNIKREKDLNQLIRYLFNRINGRIIAVIEDKE